MGTRSSSVVLMGGAFALIALLAAPGCNCGGTNPTGPDAGGPGTSDAGRDGGKPTADAGRDGGPGSQCLPDGTACSRTASGVCCSGTCGSDGFCTTPTLCGGPGTACSTGTDCCSNDCFNGQCSSQQCLDVGQSCSANADCCTGTCTNGTCAQLSGQSCLVIGQACSGSGTLPDGGTTGTCCSENCQGGVCVRAYSCQANGDICYKDSDCCGNACSKNDGSPGTCLVVTGGGGGGCTQDGNPCSGGSNCCSRICADPGSGQTVCQSAGGCRLTGDSCSSDQACCGGGTNPNGTVSCTTGRCNGGNACNPVGNICGAAVLPDGGKINAPQDCCNGDKSVCKLDSSGIPRCFGGCAANNSCPPGCPTGYDGDAGCCIVGGDTCQFSDQCCGGAKCVPDDTGTLRCTTETCKPLGSDCTAPDGGPGSGCCAGSFCGRSGEINWACQNTPPPPADGGTVSDAGTDGGTCSANGQACATSADCCSDICSSGVCQTPASCQPQGSSCTAAADCCSGLTCNVDPATNTGTCQTATCAGSGQTCSPTSACCSGLTCLTAGLQACDGTTACTCQVSIN